MYVNRLTRAAWRETLRCDPNNRIKLLSDASKARMVWKGNVPSSNASCSFFLGAWNELAVIAARVPPPKYRRCNKT